MLFLVIFLVLVPASNFTGAETQPGPPTIIAVNGSIVEESTDLFLTCMTNGSSVNLRWEFPAHSRAQKENRTVIIATSFEQKLIVRNVQLRFDAGDYRCSMDDSDKSLRIHDQINIKIIKANECYIDIGETTSSDTINVTGSEPEKQWQVDFDGNPKPLRVEWYDNNDRIIQPGNSHGVKYSHTTNTNANNQSSSAVFIIRNPVLDDIGDYTMRVVHNATCHKSRTFRLIVYARPLVRILPTTLRVGQDTLVQCSVLGYPESTIRWQWKNCPLEEHPPWQLWSDETCAKRKQIIQNGGIVHNDRIQNETFRINQKRTFQIASLSLDKVMEPGYLTCVANNDAQPSEMPVEQTVALYVLDRDEPFLIETRPDVVMADESAELACLVNMYNFTDQLRWQHNGQMLLTNSAVDGRIQVISDRLEFMHRLTLIIRPVAVSDGGIYECHAIAFDGTTTVLDEMLFVHAQKAPTIAGEVHQNLESITKHSNDMLVLDCPTTGMPVPIVRWMLNDVEVAELDDNVIIQSQPFEANALEFNHTLMVRRMSAPYAGEYVCLAKNQLGAATRSFTVELQQVDNTILACMLGLMIALLLFTVGVGVYVYRREHEKLRVLKNAGISYFDNGDITSFNPELTLMEQADLLPYDRKYEFPRDKLLLSGVRLGSGTFGVVYKAQAMAIVPNVTWTTVAVKTVKHTDKDEDIKALISELKIMILIGKHINVVNLLGAVTRDIRKRSLFVIAEFCDLGNLQIFLIKNRHMFVNDVNEIPKKIDTDTETISDAEELCHKFAYIDLQIFQTITTIDLICWSYQVACGMAYLASRGVLHGDLAARNILLCSDRVVKIYDFGLSRTLQPDENYKKESDGLLPIKWLAIESISHKIFNTSTDVWSFGILMWELFSLAQVPYTDVAFENLLIYLQQGHRMQRPTYATQALYDLMRECWCLEPECRPSFVELKHSLQNMLPAELALEYIERNEQYVNFNVGDDVRRNSSYLKVFSLSEKSEPSAKPFANKVADAGGNGTSERYVNVFSPAENPNSSMPPANNESEHSDSDNNSCGGNEEDPAPTVEKFTPRLEKCTVANLESSETFSNSGYGIMNTNM